MPTPGAALTIAARLIGGAPEQSVWCFTQLVAQRERERLRQSNTVNAATTLPGRVTTNCTGEQAPTARSNIMDPESDIDVGTRYLALSGRIWTVRSITPHPERFVLMSPSIDGDRGMIVDSAALSRMVRIESSHSDVTIEAGRASASHELDPREYAPPDGSVTEHTRVPASASTPSTRPPSTS